MTSSSQQAKARRFQELHRGPEILILPNAWDALSALLFEEAGFAALGTTSSGGAVSLGYPDGEAVPRGEMLAALQRITRVTSLPVTADIEAGFGVSVQEVVETVQGVMAAGGVGINLEDSTRLPDRPLFSIAEQVEKIQAIRAAADAENLALVINARSDVYHVPNLSAEERFAEVIQRLTAYREAGADCLFVPFLTEGETIARLAKATPGPLNILAVAGTPPLAELQRMGVARVSTGSGPYRAALTVVRRIAQELHETGTYTTFTQNILTYPEANDLVRHIPAE